MSPKIPRAPEQVRDDRTRQQNSKRRAAATFERPTASEAPRTPRGGAMTQHDNRDAGTGRYVSDEYAEQHPETTVRETRHDDSDLPPWATRKPYIDVRCSVCGADFEGDWGGPLLFETLVKARESFDEAAWVEEGDRLLCGRCDDQRWCEEHGHSWRRFDGQRPDGTDRTVWSCTRCSKTSLSDPAEVSR